MSVILKAVLPLLMVVFGFGLASADPPAICVVCQQPLKGKFLFMSSPVLRGKQPVCETCAKLSTQCSFCALPVKSNFVELSDGRLLCERDAAAAVLSQNEGQRVFEETKREMLKMLSGFGILPNRNITVSLIDARQMEKLLQSQRSSHDPHLTTGLTHTRVLGQNQFEHSIYLLSGLSRARLMAVAAHEYAHTWLHENVARERVLNADTVEAFCELIAYRLMTQQNEEVEKQVILSNAYTRGQINQLIKAEDTFQFYRVVQWIKTGRGEHIDLAAADPLSQPPAEPVRSVAWEKQLSTLVPETLVLKGISGNPQHRFALINDCTLEKNQEAKVRVGNSNVTVRCHDITTTSAIIQINGSAEKTQLFLRELR